MIGKFIYLLFIFIMSTSFIKQEFRKNLDIEPNPNDTLNIKSYNQLLQNIYIHKKNLKDEYITSDSKIVKDSLLNIAGDYIFECLEDSLFPYWYGTPWDFNGTTTTPNSGAIACGYFVTTLLEHVGFNLQRVKLAQQASEFIIKSLTSENFISRFSNTQIKVFVNEIELRGHGLYVVGLDIHTGFLLNTDEGIYFIHSTYEYPYCVIKELALNSNILANSGYRVIGKILDDDELMVKWLRDDKIVTKTN